MAKRLIFIHGAYNPGKKTEEIQEIWLHALLNAIPGGSVDPWHGVEIETVAFDDALSEATRDWGPTAGETFPKKGTPTAVSTLHRALLTGIPDARKQDADKTLRHLAAYLYKPGVFETINRLVKSQIFRENGILESIDHPIIVAHGLGGVIAYAVLREAVDGYVPLLMTMGSPLGVDPVRQRLGAPLIKPEIVERWVNVGDPMDFLCPVPELTYETFGPAELENIADLDNGYDNPNDAAKYLGQSVVASTLAQAVLT